MATLASAAKTKQFLLLHTSYPEEDIYQEQSSVEDTTTSDSIVADQEICCILSCTQDEDEETKKTDDKKFNNPFSSLKAKLCSAHLPKTNYLSKIAVNKNIGLIADDKHPKEKLYENVKSKDDKKLVIISECKSEKQSPKKHHKSCRKSIFSKSIGFLVEEQKKASRGLSSNLRIQICKNPLKRTDQFLKSDSSDEYKTETGILESSTLFISGVSISRTPEPKSPGLSLMQNGRTSRSSSIPPPLSSRALSLSNTSLNNCSSLPPELCTSSSGKIETPVSSRSNLHTPSASPSRCNENGKAKSANEPEREGEMFRGDIERRSITEGLRTALARLRQRSTPPESQTSPLHRPQQDHQYSHHQSRLDSDSLSSSSSAPTNSYCPSAPSSPRPRMTVNSQSGPPKSPRPPDDLITTATSALRRFHFKTGRNATKNSSSKQQNQPVPKVIVMGSSTASETTINTSTDSSNTIVTTMTATDGTDESLDYPEPMDIFSSENVLENAKLTAPLSPKTPATAKEQTPPTAKNQMMFTFDINEAKASSTMDDLTPKVTVEETRFQVENPRQEVKTVESLMQEQIEALRIDARRRNSYKQAQNLDEIEVMSDSCFVASSKEHRRSFKKKLEVEKQKAEKTSPKRRAERNGNSSPEETDSPRPKHRHKKSSRRTRSPSKYHSQTPDKFTYDERQVSKYRARSSISSTCSRRTPPLPDLRVDFFSDSSENWHKSNGAPAGTPTLHTLGLAPGVSTEKRGSVCLNKCLREVGAHLEQTCTSPINVTTNPLDPVHFNSGNRKTPQATIVVQQPSVSLDHTNVSTILLKNESEFVSNVQDGAKGRLKREENMKQLLDVAHNLTLEEMHDFEMKYGSPHHNRSQSVKTPGRASGRPNYLCLPQQRSRVASMPNTGVEEEYYRLRHFSITGKGVVNRGDSLKSRRSRSNNSVASSNSSTEQLPTAVSAAGSARTSASCSLASSRESSTSAPGPTPYKVLMLGGPAVGKSSLVLQFMTSEYLHAYDTSIDDDSGEKSVSVLLAGEESELCFIDFATADLSPESCINKYSDPHAYCVVYSSADRSSLDIAEKILQNLWTLDTISTKAVILVANKADLVRSRVVSTEEGKSMATSYDCKYIETSVGINHNVDELLVGILTQIRLKLENPERTRDIFRKRSSSKKNLNRNKSPASGAATPTGSVQNSPKKYRGSRTSASLKVRSLLGKVWARDSKSKSCENLHVL